MPVPNPTIWGPVPTVHDSARAFGILRDIYQIMGATKSHLWPFSETTGALVRSMGVVNLEPSDETSARNLEDEFTPIFSLRDPIANGYTFSGDNSRHLVAADNAELSFEGADEPFSAFVWARPRETGSALQALMAKYDEGVATEYSFHVTSGDLLQLDLYDGIDGATGDLRYTSVNAAADTHELRLYGFTYAGAEGAVSFYKDGQLMDAIAAVQTGAFVNMDDTAAKFFIGGRDDGGAPDDLFDGLLAGPAGVTQRELTAQQWRDLYALARALVGV
jgi:hypothetical protein